jgi:hypothetical protein
MSARLAAETSAPAKLDEALRWLIDRQYNPVRLGFNDLPALGQDCWLKLALPITAPRAVICALWLIEDIDDGGCLLAGQLRFIGHPTGMETRLSFSGRTAVPIEPGQDAARQLIGVIAASIKSRSTLADAALAG